MGKISLRLYTKEIENLVERGESQEAIAHCKYILKQFPKHIDTYRLLGKAFLELRRYSEASDILQRVLSVLPDDFVSHLGMSIIREDENNLNAAIWHMERAFEVQPSNPVVQEELRRLYGRRDGAVPPKVRLTRGALVRMYMRGELYTQAIAEARAALAEDTRRYDLNVILARLYYLQGQKVEAAETCSQIIKKLPFCFEANRILAEIIPTTSRAEEAKAYQQRVIALDPYTAFLSPPVTASDQIPENAVTLERLDYIPTQEVSSQPTWAQTVGVQLEESKESLPEWLDTIPSEKASIIEPPTQEKVSPDIAQPAPIQTVAPAVEVPEIQEDIIPEWMKEAGWTKSTGTFEEKPGDFLGEEEKEIQPADLPDWLKEIAPSPEEETPSDSNRTEFLEQILPPSTGVAITSAEQAPQNMPEVTKVEVQDNKTLPIEPQIDSVQPGVSEEEIPDWLKDFTKGETASVIEAKTKPEESEKEITSADLPAWIQEITPGAASQSESRPAGLEPKKESGEFENIPAWLQDLTPESREEPSKSEGAPALISQEPVEEVSDWLKEMSSEEMAAPSSEIPSSSKSILIPGKVLEAETTEDIQQSEAVQPATSIITPENEAPEEIPAWLQQIGTEDASTSLQMAKTPGESAKTAPLQAQDEVPEWLRSIRSEETNQKAEESPASIAESDRNIANPSTDETGEVPSDIDAAMAWMESLAARQGAAPETLLTSPEERTGIAPEWIQKEVDASSASLDEKENVPTGESHTEPGILAGAEAISSDALELPTLKSELGFGALEGTEGSQPSYTSEQQPEVETVALEEIHTDGETLQALEESGLSVHKSEMTQAEQQVEEVHEEITSANVEAIDNMSSPQKTSEEDLDSAFAWLESLATRQGVDESTLLVKPEERPTAPPDWIVESTTENIQPIISTSNSEEQSAPLESSIPAAMAQPEEEVIIPDWLKDISTEIESEEHLDQPPEWLKEVPAAEETPVNEIITTQVEKASSSAAQTSNLEDTAPIQRETLFAQELEHIEPVIPVSDLKEEPGVLAEKFADEVSQQPAPEISIDAEAASIETGIIQAEPVMAANPPVETLSPVETVPSEQFVAPQAAETAPAEQSLAPETSHDSKKDLEEARSGMILGKVEESLFIYEQLVVSGAHLDETIKDLREAVYKYPVEFSIWQVLGDALMKSNKLQSALDAYTKAEELLR
jgi:tetratricopeptide (TPR) repeat protein